MVAIQIDLKEPFDKIAHKAVADAVVKNDVSTHFIAVLCRMWQQSTITAKLDHVAQRRIVLHRGVPQGAPESPLIFAPVSDEIMDDLQESWSKRGLGWSTDRLWIPRVDYADDVIILDKTQEGAQSMLLGCIKAFEKAGLEVGMKKTSWS